MHAINTIFLVRDAEASQLQLDEVAAERCMDHLRGSSICYRIAVGSRAGRKVFSLQTVSTKNTADATGLLARTGGFSLHAGVSVAMNDRAKRERLCRYITRPAVSNERLSITAQGQVCYRLKTAYRDGTTHVFFEPLDFIGKRPINPTLT